MALSEEAMGEGHPATYDKKESEPLWKSPPHWGELSEEAHGEGNTPPIFFPGVPYEGDVDR